MNRNTHALVALLLIAAAAGACGEWSGAPAVPPEATAIPLGPGPTIVLAEGGLLDGPPAAHGWSNVVAVAWAESAPGGTAIRVAISRDAALTFGSPTTLTTLRAQHDARTLDVQVAVAAPGPVARVARVWVRGGPARQWLAWESRDAGTTFVEAATLGSATDAAFPPGWTHVDGVQNPPDTTAILPPAALQHAGCQHVAWPEGGRVNPREPAVTVDDHGALALAWTERGDQGRQAIVVRRAWVNWNADPRGQSRCAEAPAFDAAYTLGTATGEVSRPEITRIPGGVVVAWAAERPEGGRAVYVRRLGLDMTCTRESAKTGTE